MILHQIITTQMDDMAKESKKYTYLGKVCKDYLNAQSELG